MPLELKDLESTLDELEQNDRIQHQEPYPLIGGSPSQAFIAGAFATYTGRGLIGVFNPPVTEMQHLNQVLRGLLAASPVISTMLTQIPISHYVDKHGGKKQVLLLLVGAVIGMGVLTGFSAAIDITLIDGFGWEYVTLLSAGCLIGLGSGTFPLIINAIQWVKQPARISVTQNAFGSIADFSGVTTPVAVYLLKSYGYAVPFAVYTGILLSGMAVAARYVVLTPYHQARKYYPHEAAKKLAIEAGQLPEMINNDEVELAWRITLKNHYHTLFNLRGLTLNFAFFTTLGSFFVTETILPTLLKNGFGATQGEAIITASLANLLTILVRIPAGKLLSYWSDRSGGVKVHLIGCGLTALGAIPLAFIDLPRWALYASVGVLNSGYGVGIMTSTYLVHPWKSPANKKMAPLNASTMLGILGTVGTAGGLVLPITMGLMVDAEGEAGYKHYFALILSMALLSGLLVYLTHLMVNKKDEESMFGNPMNLFRCIRHAESSRGYLFRDDSPVPLTETYKQPTGMA